MNNDGDKGSHQQDTETLLATTARIDERTKKMEADIARLRQKEREEREKIDSRVTNVEDKTQRLNLALGAATTILTLILTALMTDNASIFILLMLFQ